MGSKWHLPTKTQMAALESVGNPYGSQEMSADELTLSRINSYFSKIRTDKGKDVINKEKTLFFRNKEIDVFFSSKPSRMQYFKIKKDKDGFPCVVKK